MRKKRGPWVKMGQKIIYRTPKLTIFEDQLLDAVNRKAVYAHIAAPPGVLVLPIDAKGNVYLCRQYRYPLGRYSIEAIGGGIERGESPLKSAKRELKEEAGIIAKKWKFIGKTDPFPVNLNSPGFHYIAEGLSFTDQALDEDESITVLKMSLTRALDMINDSKITDSDTVAVLLLAARHKKIK